MKICILGFLLAVFSLIGVNSSVVAPTLRILVLDVGDGSAVLIRDPSGKSALLLGASEFARVPERLRSIGVHRISILVALNLNNSSATPLRTFLETMEPDVFISNPVPYPIPTGAYALSHLRNSILNRRQMGLTRVEVPEGQTHSLGYALITTIPADGRLSGTAPDSSPVVKIQFRGFSFLALGQSGPQTEQFLISSFPSNWLRSDVLFYSGASGEPPSIVFLNAVRPRLLVASVSGSPLSASPRYALMFRTASAHVPLARTDLLGSLTLATRGADLLLSDMYGRLSVDSPRRFPAIILR